MTKWEYKTGVWIKMLHGEFFDWINEMGDSGWELVSTEWFRPPSDPSPAIEYIFKRPKEEAQ